MAVFRVERSKGYTVMSSHIQNLRRRNGKERKRTYRPPMIWHASYRYIRKTIKYGAGTHYLTHE